MNVAVVGGGITGLSAAWSLSGIEDAPRTVVLEAGDRLGGKILTPVFGGRPVDAGPDAFIARAPQGLELCAQLGLGDELVAPPTSRAYVWTRGSLRPLPTGLFLGAPARMLPLARSGIVSRRGLLRAGMDLLLPATNGYAPDRSVGELVSARLGTEVTAALVDPVLGGIHGGAVDSLSVAATAPELDAAASSHRSLLVGMRGAARAASSGSKETTGPVFRGLEGGMGRMVEVLGRRLDDRGVDLRAGSPVASARFESGRWTLSTPRGPLRADAVIIATPAPATARLLEDCCPEAARELRGIEYASVAVVTISYDARAVSRPLDGSGFLVPASQGRLITACTWMSSKWPYLARPGEVLLRASTGRFGDERALTLDDARLTAAVHGELCEAMGIRLPPGGSRVTRWPEALPQYRVGHLERVRLVEEAVGAVPGLAVAGSALRGVGIPACIAQGRAAAAKTLAFLGRRCS